MRQPPHRRAVLTLCLILTAVLVPASPAQAAPTFAGILAGPSVAATYPSGIEYDDAGNRLVVADTGLDRIEFYTYAIGATPATSTFQRTGMFGSHGTGTNPPQFDSPRDVAVDEQGQIYVADAGNNRVVALSPSGAYRWHKGSTGTCNDCLNTPIGVTWDAANDVLLVASTGQDRIKAFDANGVFKWQTRPVGGTGTAQLIDIDAPRDVNRGPDGRIWITDYHRHVVKAFNATGAGVFQDADGNGGNGITPAITLDGVGTDDGALNFPYNVDFSLDGNTVYVSDTGKNRVARWNLTTTPPTPLSSIGGDCPEAPNPCPDPPDDLGEIDTLRRVVVDEAGRLVTADFWGNGMQVWQANGAPALEIELFSPDPEGFAQAFGLATAPDGKIFAVDRLNQHLEYYQANGDFVGAFGNRGTSLGRFSWPEAVAVSPNGQQAFVADTRGDEIHRFQIASGTFDRSWPPSSPTGSGPQQLNYAEDLDVGPDGLVYVADTRNDRVQVLDPSLTTNAFVRRFGTQGTTDGALQDPQGVVVAADGDIYVADTGNNRIQRFSNTGAFEARSTMPLNGPQGIALDPDGTVWVADTRNDRIVHLSANLQDLGHTFGSAGTGDLRFDLPHTLDVAGDSLYVADTFNDRVQIVDISSLGGGTPDTTPPQAPVIASPTANQTFTSVPVPFNGTATDNVAVAKVEVAIKDRTQNLWLQADDTWGATFRKRLTTLGSPNAATTTWSYSWTPPAGGSGAYSVQVVVTDTANLVTSLTRQFNVTSGGGGAYSPAFQISNPGGVAPLYPAGGAAASNGTRYIADSGGSRIVQLSSTGVQSVLSDASSWNDPRDLEVDVSDPASLWVANTSASQIVKLGTNGAIASTFTAGGVINQPYGIANDATGVYVANTYANTVVKLSKTGSVLWTRGNCGNVNFGRPRDVAVGSNGQVYVADTDRNRIVRLNASDGTCAGTFGVAGSNPGQLRAPRAVASDGVNGIWVAEGGTNNRLQHFSNAGTYVPNSAIGGFGEGNAQFRSAHCVFMDGALVAVCDTFNYRIQRFSVNGSGVPAFHSILGGTRPVDGGFNGAFDVAYGPDGSIYVTDWFDHRIQKFTATGGHVASWGGYGSPNGSFIFPRGIAVRSDGVVVVTDSENNRIDLLQPNGSFIGSIVPTGTPKFLRPHQTAIAADGTYWVADTGNNRVVNINGSGTILRTIPSINQPRGVAVDASGNVYVSTGGQVRKIAPNGTATTIANTGGGNTQVRSPYGLRIVGSGASAQLLIGDRGNNRILVLTLTGQYVTQFGVAGSGANGLTQPQGADRNPLTGQIAVADFGNDRVSVWAPS